MSADASTLEVKLQHGPLSPDEAVRIIWALCDRFEKQGKRETLGDVTPARVTVAGRLVEAHIPDDAPVAGFSAPERAQSGPTPRSDVYAMGTLLAFLLRGKDPDGTLPVAASHLAPVVAKARAHNPTERFASLSELKRALVRLDKTLMSGGATTTTSGSHVAVNTLGPWKLEGLLGQGSMGHVFRARHQALGRLAAIKVLRPEQYQDPELVKRFFQEARTVNQINHEHIVEISDFVQEPGPKGPSIVYCVMEFLQGRTLGDELESGPIRLTRGVRIVMQLADALAAAHRVGVVHRDVKPDNIMLIERGGSRDYVKVLDFGVAKLTDTDGKSMLSTTEGAIIGTPICMSPEQAQGDEVDARSDVWAVGVILYRLLTGRFPFEAATFVNIAVQIITKPHEPLPSKTVGGEPIPPRLAALVEKCLHKDRAARPASMDAVREELRAVLTPPKPAFPWKFVIGGLSVALALGAVAFAVSQKRDAEVVTPPTGPTLPVVAPPIELEIDAGNPSLDTMVPEPVDAGADPGPVDAGTSARSPVEPRPVKPVKPVVLTQARALEVFKRSATNIKKCLNASQGTIPTQGQVIVKLVVPTTGVPKDIAVELGFSSPTLEKCVRREAEKMRFPVHIGPEARTGYGYPFNLK